MFEAVVIAVWISTAWAFIIFLPAYHALFLQWAALCLGIFLGPMASRLRIGYERHV